MVILAPAAHEIRSAAAPAAQLSASVMMMSVGGRFALVAGGIVAVWTSIALALS